MCAFDDEEAPGHGRDEHPPRPRKLLRRWSSTCSSASSSRVLAPQLSTASTVVYEEEDVAAPAPIQDADGLLPDWDYSLNRPVVTDVHGITHPAESINTTHESGFVQGIWKTLNFEWISEVAVLEYKTMGEPGKKVAYHSSKAIVKRPATSTKGTDNKLLYSKTYHAEYKNHFTREGDKDAAKAWARTKAREACDRSG